MVRGVFKTVHMWHCFPDWPEAAWDIWGTWEMKGPFFSHSYHGDWHGSLTWCVIAQTFSLAGEPAEELSAASSLSSPPGGHWSLSDPDLGGFDIVPKVDQCNDWRSLLFSLIFFFIVLLEVFNLKQLTDWPYSKIAPVTALMQPLQWWTGRQRRKLSTRLEPFKLPLLPEKNAPLHIPKLCARL